MACMPHSHLAPRRSLFSMNARSISDALSCFKNIMQYSGKTASELERRRWYIRKALSGGEEWSTGDATRTPTFLICIRYFCSLVQRGGWRGRGQFCNLITVEGWFVFLLELFLLFDGEFLEILLETEDERTAQEKKFEWEKSRTKLNLSIES